MVYHCEQLNTFLFIILSFQTLWCNTCSQSFSYTQ